MTFPGDVPDPTAPQAPAPLDISVGSVDAAPGEAAADQGLAVPSPEATASAAEPSAAAPSAVDTPPPAPAAAPSEPSPAAPIAPEAAAPAMMPPLSADLQASEPVATPAIPVTTPVGPVDAPAVVPSAAIPAAAVPSVQATPVAPGEASGEPQLAAIIEIPAQPSSAETEDNDGGEGGEWELLLTQVREWLTSLKLQQTIQGLRRPLSLLGWLLAVIVVLRVYTAVVGTLDRLPLLPGLLELVGVIVSVRFAATNLLRSQQRQALLQQLGDRWKAFRG